MKQKKVNVDLLGELEVTVSRIRLDIDAMKEEIQESEIILSGMESFDRSFSLLQETILKIVSPKTSLTLSPNI
jgi:hypothetical protein